MALEAEMVGLTVQLMQCSALHSNITSLMHDTIASVLQDAGEAEGTGKALSVL